MTVGNLAHFAVACNRSAAVIARSPAMDLFPSPAANAVPYFSAVSNGTGLILPVNPPLSPIAPANNPFDNGDAICAHTEIDPANSPAIVTRAGSPPKAAIFCCTHTSAAC